MGGGKLLYVWFRDLYFGIDGPFCGSFSAMRTRSAEGVGAHFFHYLAAMEFNRDLARAQLQSDLLVEHSFDDEPKDFRFARRQ